MRIALSGQKGCGKSTAATYLLRRYPDMIRVSLADPLKEVCATVFQIPSAHWHDPVLKESVLPDYGVTPRTLMQKIGTELFREALRRELPELRLPYGPTIWLNIAGAKIATARSVVVDDMRFDDESEFLHMMDFVRLRIARGEEKLATHASEAGCPVDAVIENNGTLEELYANLDMAISRLMVSRSPATPHASAPPSPPEEMKVPTARTETHQ